MVAVYISIYIYIYIPFKGNLGFLRKLSSLTAAQELADYR